MAGSLIFWIAALPLAAACVSDVRWRLVPDWASLALFILGLVAVATSTQPMVQLTGGLAGTIFAILAAVFGLWGWGDAKLFSGAALIAGPAGAAGLVMGMALTGGLLVLASVSMRPMARRYATSAGSQLPRWVRNEFRRCRLAPSIPYAVAIAGGVAGSAAF